MTARRVLSVWIDSTAIEAGDVSPPQVGSILRFPMHFREVTSSGDGVGLMTVRGVLDLADKPPSPSHGTNTQSAKWRWEGTLRGDGWSASWEGRHPRVGQVELTGHFEFGWGMGSPMRGVVTRVRMATRLYRQVRDRVWEPDPDAASKYRDVDKAPRWPRSDEPSRPTEPYSVTYAALVDLDLEEIPPAPPRPHVIAYDVSAESDTVWVVDQRLPVVVCLHPDETATEYLLPERPYVGREVFATPSGCWVNGADATYRIVHGQPAEKVFDHRAVIAATGESVLARTDHRQWKILTPDAPAIVVDVPPGMLYGAVVDGDTITAIHKETNNPGGGVRLVRVTTTGAVSIGPVLPPIPSNGIDPRWTLAGSPLHLFCGGDVAVPIRSDLSAVPPVTIPETVLWAGSADDLIWVVTHPPSADHSGVLERWPFHEPTTYDRTRGQFWLITLLDPTTMKPTASYPIHDTRPKVARTADGTIWTAGNRLQTLAGGHMQWSDPVDVDPMIKTTIDPVPPIRTSSRGQTK